MSRPRKPPAALARVMLQSGVRWRPTDVDMDGEPPIHVRAPAGSWFAGDGVTELLCWSWDDVAERLAHNPVEPRPDDAGPDADEWVEALTCGFEQILAGCKAVRL